jgi:hypothetical protein
MLTRLRRAWCAFWREPGLEAGEVREIVESIVDDVMARVEATEPVDEDPEGDYSITRDGQVVFASDDFGAAIDAWQTMRSDGSEFWAHGRRRSGRDA